MFDEMTERGFVEFLAALWESRGWETGITERDEGVFMITGDKADGTRGLMLVVPDPTETVSGQVLQKTVTLVQDKGIDTAVAATRGSFSDDADGVAQANGVHLLDPAALEETVGAEDAHHLVEEFTQGSAGGRDGGGGEGGSIADRLPSMGLPVPGGIGLGGTLRTLLLAIVAVGVVVAAVQFLGFGDLLSGLVAGLPLPEVGLGGGGGYTITAVSLSQGNGTPVGVTWNARPQSTVVAPNGESFNAPEGKQFVVVQVNVTNPGNESLIFRADYLALATQDTRYGNQPLQGASGQLPVQVQPGNSTRAFVVYTVPADAESATLLGLPGPDNPPIDFQRDESMAFQVEGR